MPTARRARPPRSPAPQRDCLPDQQRGQREAARRERVIAAVGFGGVGHGAVARASPFVRPLALSASIANVYGGSWFRQNSVADETSPPVISGADTASPARAVADQVPVAPADGFQRA
jgi:hypothetical protein